MSTISSSGNPALQCDLNQTEAFRYLLSEGGRTVATCERFSWFTSGNPCWGNAVFGLKLTDGDAVSNLKEAIRSGNVPNLVKTGPADVPQPIAPFMEKNGFVLRSVTSGMVLTPQDFAYRPKKADPGFELREASADEAGAWAGIVTRNLFGSDSEDGAADFASAVRSVMPGKRMAFYLALLNGVPVGASALYRGDVCAGIYFVATERAYRSRGIGYEATAAAVREGLRGSTPLVILQATELGKTVYEKLGFREAVTLGRWYLP